MQTLATLQFSDIGHYGHIRNSYRLYVAYFVYNLYVNKASSLLSLNFVYRAPGVHNISPSHWKLSVTSK